MADFGHLEYQKSVNFSETGWLILMKLCIMTLITVVVQNLPGVQKFKF